MRTTVSISDHLLDEARLLATRTERSLGEVIDDALRVLFANSSKGSTTTVTLPVYGGSGLLPGVDVHDPALLAAVLDED